MSVTGGPNIVEDGLVLCLDATNSKLKTSSLRYRWWSTVGGNPTTKAGFDAFFTGSPNEVGIHSTTIDWLTVGVRPTYLPETQFAWEVKGLIKIDISGTYVFNTRSDDGNELQINNEIVTSFYGGRGVPNPGDISASITLATGIYPFQYRMQQGAGGSGAQVRWQIPGSSTYEVIPASNFLVGLGDDVFVDLSRNGNDGILINGSTFDSGNLGSIVFDGVNDYVDTGLQFDKQDFVYSAWVKFSSTGGTFRDIIDSFESTSAEWARLCLVNGSFAFLTDNNSVRVDAVGSSASTGVWYYMAGVRNGASMILYVNGSVNATATQSQTGIISGLSSERIGSQAISTSELFHGNISGVQIYNRALTADEVLQNFNATKGRFGL
jgi:hypothetical protein